ncbi:MAG: chalcone isomerase family protein [Actinomycetota bacterium]
MRKLAVALSILLLSSQAFAVDVAGVSVAPAVSVHQKTLTLNGSGIRKKLFIKVYVGSLYTERKATSPAQLLADPGEKLIRMNFVYKKVEREKITEAFAEGLANNSPAVAGTAEAKAFLSWFTSDFVAGDTVDISLAPDGTVTASQNGKTLGTVRSPALARGVLLIWFGEKPADSGLKKGMLGQG